MIFGIILGGVVLMLVGMAIYDEFCGPDLKDIQCTEYHGDY